MRSTFVACPRCGHLATACVDPWGRVMDISPEECPGPMEPAVRRWNREGIFFLAGRTICRVPMSAEPR